MFVNNLLNVIHSPTATVIPPGPTESYDIDAKFICHQNLLQYTTEYYPVSRKRGLFVLES
jgi:hypothetical protein